MGDQEKLPDNVVVLNEDEEGNPTSIGICADQALIDYAAENSNISKEKEKND